MNPNELTRQIIGAAIEVHRELGPGKTEAAYELALVREFLLRGIPHKAQKPLPVVYKGVKLDCGYRLDALVDNTVVVEAKAVEAVHPIHRAQGLTYLKLGGWKVGLLLNFNVAVLKDGIERLVLGFHDSENAPAIARRDPRRRAANDSTFSGNADIETERFATQVIDAAREIHKELGPGLLASAYEACFCHELRLRRIPFERKRRLTLTYKGTPLDASDEVELLVGSRLVVSPRAVFSIEPVHVSALLSQLRLGGWRLGLLINFNTIMLKDAIRRVISI